MSRPRTWGDQRGQASVELALVLPVVVLLAVLVFQVALLGRDRVHTVHAARAAARAVIVEPTPAAARSALERQGLSDRASVRVGGQLRAGGLAEVTVSVRPRVLPLFDRVLGSRRLTESLTVLVEDG